ncbi:MAG: SPFH domain-containing protein [Micrococcaceae bacterium]
MVSIILSVFIVIIALVSLQDTFFIVRQQTNVIIERFGKFKHIKAPGFRVKIPFIDRKAFTANMRIQQLDVNIETKTKDNVFVNLAVSVQYYITQDKVSEAFYKLNDAQAQISAYVFDSIRSAVPARELDSVFSEKDAIAKDVQNDIQEAMSEYGYTIVKALVTDIEPDSRVKDSMNSINAAKRDREAAQEQANADKIRVVTNAQAEKESQILRGEGIAGQRKAIANGLKESVSSMVQVGIGEADVLKAILRVEELDTYKAMGDKGNGFMLVQSDTDNQNAKLTQSVLNGTLAANKAMDNKSENL